MSAEHPQYVVDASVAGKWYLQDEAFVTEATALLTDFRDGRVHLVAPDHIRYEVPSLIRNAIAQGRIASADARNAIELFLSLDIPTVRSSSLILFGFDQTVRFGANLYDGLYVALSELSGAPLIHADDRLRRTLRNRFAGELWIGDYRSAKQGAES